MPRGQPPVSAAIWEDIAQGATQELSKELYEDLKTWIKETTHVLTGANAWGDEIVAHLERMERHEAEYQQQIWQLQGQLQKQQHP